MIENQNEFTIADVKRIVVKPGDVLLISVKRGNSPIAKFKEYLDSLKPLIDEIFPDNKTIIHGEALDIEILTQESNE